MITIEPFNSIDQEHIDCMLMDISKEFETPIFNKSASTKAISFDNYWVAFNEEEVIGTISILRIENGASVLKNMFVKKEFRGRTFGVAHRLLQHAFTWCESEHINTIYLGTMEQFVAAHKFYEKNGFQKIAKSELPERFIHNPIDTVFYKVRI